MKRIILCLALSAGLLSGCSETQATTTRADLSGTYDLALVGRYIFVTSSNQNELRVLDVEASPRTFVTAPNPLEPLSIPVLERPSHLTRDVGYAVEIVRDAQGNEVSKLIVEDAGGPYVHARSFGSQEISVVAADPAYFQERHRVRAQGLVTAFSARGPVPVRTLRQTVNENNEVTGQELLSEDLARPGSVLYYAAQDGLDAKLYRVELPGPEALTRGSAVTPQALELDLTGKTVAALLVLPPPVDQPAQELLVVATRNTMGSGGETFRVRIGDGVATREADYDFGSPVRLLATHPRAERLSEEDWHTCSFDRELESPPSALAAGQFVFGVLDESACGGQPGCSGVLAVDAATGLRARDASGLPMLPISVAPALPTGLTLAAGVDVNLPCKISVDPEPERIVPIVKRPLVGIVPASNGVITLFDAVRMRPFDLNPKGVSASLALVDPTAAAKEISAEQLATHLTVGDISSYGEGVTRDDIYRLTYQGALPELNFLTSVDRRERTGGNCPAGSTCFEVEPGAATRVEPGDVVVPRGNEGPCKDGTGKEVDYIVTGKLENPSLLVTSPPSPSLVEACQELPNIIVRASGSRPFVVISNAKGFLGRLGEGETLEVPGRYYYQPSAVLDPDPREVRITLKLIDTREISRGDQYIVTTLSHFLPYVFGVDTNSLGVGLVSYRLPGSVVYTRVGGADLAYIAYPSANGVLQVSLEAIRNDTANTTGLVPFE